MSRAEILQQLQSDKVYDLLVIGGGATGAGIALDAASRGLSVLLAEQNDFAEGTSSRSSKLVHGGVRYLEMAVKQLDRDQYQLVREGLKERHLFLRNAPHLARRLPLLTPLYRWWRIPYLWCGLKLYDLLAGGKSLGRSGFVSRRRTLQDWPQLQRAGLQGSIRYFDGQFQDSRMVLALLQTAQQSGALVVNHLRIDDLLKEQGRLVGVQAEDRLTGNRLQLRASCVVNATGPFSDSLRRCAEPEARGLLTVSSGIHIVLSGRYPPPAAGLLISRTEDGRVIFVLPWEGRCLVGTTERLAELGEHPVVQPEEIDYLLRHLQCYLDPPPNRADIRACWSGLRPLVQDPKASDSARLLRDFVIEKSEAGLLSIVGGKWTSYRRMAEKLVDRAVEEFALPASGPCRTRQLPLHGAADWQPEGWQQLVSRYQLDEASAHHLHRSYGDQAERVAELATGALRRHLHEDFPYLEAEVLHAVRHEFAERAIDVLARRIPLALLDSEAAGQAAETVIGLMAQELGWDERRIVEERQLLERRLTDAL